MHVQCYRCQVFQHLQNEGLYEKKNKNDPLNYIPESETKQREKNISSFYDDFL